MYCLVDFRNRPQCKYAFHTRENACGHLEKIKNNPLGVTAIYSDGRREYFENGLPKGFFVLSDKSVQIKKGCHVKYKIRELNLLDGLAQNKKEKPLENISGWKKKFASPLFMLGNRKFSAGLLVISLFIFSASYFFQKNLGQQVSAQSFDEGGLVLGASTERESFDDSSIEGKSADDAGLQIADEDVILNLLGKVEAQKNEEFEKEILKYIKGRPMEAMAPHIAKQPRIVAAFIVGIAMKESKFGVYAPHSGGRDCFNYWGYRGRENTTASGYSCFNSPEHAINVIGKKISSLVNRGISNPAEMISWKCGSTCAGHGAENVRKWISDVGIHFYKLNS